MVRDDAYRTGDWRRRFGTSSTTRRYWGYWVGTGARKQQTDRASVFLWRTEAMERRERFSERTEQVRRSNVNDTLDN
jgi:hypothetical protein